VTTIEHREELGSVDDALELPFRQASHFGEDTPPEDDRLGIVGRFWRDLTSVKELRRTPYGMTPILIFGFMTFFQRFDAFAISAAIPEIVRDLGINIGQIFDILSLSGVVGLLVALAVGWWADRHKRVPIYALGNFLGGLSASMSGFGKRTVTFGSARVADQAGETMGDVPAFSLLSDYYAPESRGRAFAFQATLARIGQLIAIGIVPLMISHYGVGTALKIYGIPIMVMAVLAAILLREPVRGYFERKTLGADDDTARLEDEPQSFGEGWRTTFSVRTIRRIFVANIIGSTTDFIDILVLGFYSEIYGLSILQRTYYFLPAVFLGLIGGTYGGGLVDRFTTRNPGRVLTIYGVYQAVATFTFVFYALRPPIAVLVAVACVRGFFISLTGPAITVVTSQVIPPSIRTQGIQITALAGLTGVIIGPQLLNAVFASSGGNNYTAVFLFVVPFGLISGIVYATAGGFFDIDRRNALAQSIAAEDWKRAKEAGSTKLLVCREVDVAYDGGVQVLFSVDLDVEEGEIIALLGTNGAGKSTLLRAISGTQEASGGAIVFDGRDITHMPPHEIAQRRVVQMPGGKGIFPGLTVRENLQLGGWINDELPAAEKRRLIAETYQIFPRLRERADEPAGLLSGGEQQQLSLAQAFLMQPKLLLIDELSLGLAPAVVGQLLEIVRDIHARGVTIIVVEQSVNVALNLATRAVFMEKGEVKFDGATADLLARPDILRAVYVKGTGGTGLTSGTTLSERRQHELDTAAVPALAVRGMAKRFGGVVAVDGVDLVLREGEVLGLIGPNGSGKTTLFDLISGYIPADAGAVLLGGQDISKLAPEARAKLGLVRRFQDAKLFPSLTVFETLLIALEQRIEIKSGVLAAVAAPQARRSERRVRARAEKLIELMGLEAYRDKFIKELSTGLRRIVDLACVLAAEPTVLLLDEPSSGIAQAEAEGLAPLLRRVRFETGCSILIIEHDMPLISAVSDELVALERGRVVVQGTPEVVLNDERVVSAYLGGTEAAINRSGSIT
jgi:ABC-type branched-subunit amino acid transport system ATPase component/MFS family permease